MSPWMATVMFNDPHLTEAIARGARRASRSMLSAHAMGQYLAQWHPSVADQAVAALTDMGLVDDAVLARERAVAKQAQQWGRYRIRADLQQRGIPEEYITEALSGLKDDETVCEAAAAKLARRHSGSVSPEVALRRTVGGLARLGFPASLSYRAASAALLEHD